MVLPWHKAALQRLVKEGTRLPHALLLRGPAGIGKGEFARSLAQALLCEGTRPDDMGCSTCMACEWVAQDAHPDFRVVAPENNQEQDEEGSGEKKKGNTQISVSQIRDLTELVNLSSHRGHGKVILINPAEAMNASAANALLKSLEEPPPATYFLLVSHRWHQLPATVKSRCRQVILPSPSLETAREWLVEQGTAQADLALAQTGGAPVSAVRFASDYWEQRTVFLGMIASTTFDPLRAAEQLREFAPADAVKWLQQWSYDMALHGVVGSTRYNPDFSDEVARVARRSSLIDTLRFHRQMVGWQRVVNHPLNPRLLLEELLLSYAALVRAGRSSETA